MNPHSREDAPLVTVLVPTFNRRRFLADALASLVAQTYETFEAIVINDGGAGVRDVVDGFADPRLVLIERQENRGKAASLNEALERARGTYVAYLDDDDRYYPNHLARLVETLEGRTDCGVAYTDLYKVHCRLRPDGSRQVLGKVVNVSRDFDRFFLCYFNHTLHVSVMHRRDLLERTGPYDESLAIL
ncbi:MAG: glycosyltransferase, partial [Planctomycetota bacterium]|nr:glycosyltransferase [Planctomycetota bacterium]